MSNKNLIHLKNIKLILIGVMISVLFFLNLFVLNKVITNSNQEIHTERTIKLSH